MIDAKAFGIELAGIVKAATAPIMARMDALEKALAERPEPAHGKDGRDGKDADPDAVAALVLDQIKGSLSDMQDAVDAIPEAPVLPVLPDIAAMVGDAVAKAVSEWPDFVAMIGEAVAKAVAEIPTPRDGVDGKDGVDGRDGADGKDGERGEAGRDGLDVKDMLRADGGRLIAVMSDGTTKDLGQFVGADGRDGANGKDGADGRDGLGFEDLMFDADEHGRPVAKFQRGEVVKTASLPCIIDRGPYRVDEDYRKGDAVSFGGSLWIAQVDTSERPESGAAWRLAVKKGRDGRDTEAKKVL